MDTPVSTTALPDSRQDKVSKSSSVLAALAEAQKSCVRVQATLKEANQLAVQIPMYDRLGKIVTELRNMSMEVPRLPL